MNLYIIGFLLLILSLEVNADQGDTKGGNQSRGPPTKGHHRPPTKGNKRPLSHPFKEVQDYTEIIPIMSYGDEEEENDDKEPESKQNKQATVSLLKSETSLARRLRARSSPSSHPSVEDNNDSGIIHQDDDNLKQNWWTRKDLRLRKLHKKLDQEEQQMMELMYGFSL